MISSLKKEEKKLWWPNVYVKTYRKIPEHPNLSTVIDN